MAQSDGTNRRPLSPHLQIWKWHWTMASSIFHRVSGIGLYGGAVLVTAWLMALAAGPKAYGVIEGVILSAPGQLLLFLWMVAVLYHFASGLRHLIWDGPQVGFGPKIASFWSMFNFGFAIIGASVIWSLNTHF